MVSSMLAIRIGAVALFFAVTTSATQTTTNITQGFEIELNEQNADCNQEGVCESDFLATSPSQGLNFSNLLIDNLIYNDQYGRYFGNIPVGYLYATSKNETATLTSNYNGSCTHYFKLKSFFAAAEVYYTYINGPNAGEGDGDHLFQIAINSTIVVKGYNQHNVHPIATKKFNYTAAPFHTSLTWNMQEYILPASFSNLHLTKVTFEVINHTPAIVSYVDPYSDGTPTDAQTFAPRLTLDEISYQTINITAPRGKQCL